ncbi:MAG: hypothetical protein AAB890_01600 [Patescibacteria group bacterium]
MKFNYWKFPLPQKSKFFGSSILRPIIPVQISLHGHGILGQKGFFDMFVVKFDFLKKEIELKGK